ncbi:MAG: long-chain fatty acid--CoA ligase, partial [Prevotella sp.]|nr:long-chain fatty acid--CoA ligase [Prevotella sp.]
QSSKASKIESITTADLGYIDDEGMLHLTGRADDVINVGGYKVAPTEVEDAALTHPAVADCICIAVPSPITGNALKLLVVTAPEQSFSPRQLAQYLSKHLERHKVPLLYQQVETIRRTFNGKIDRKYYRKE